MCELERVRVCKCVVDLKIDVIGVCNVRGAQRLNGVAKRQFVSQHYIRLFGIMVI